MIGQFVQKLHQGVAPQRSMANGGGSGGGSSGTPYYANQDKLFGAQADIAQNLYNQYASLAPGYLQNSLDMTNEAMDGTLADKMRQQAGNDAAAANGNSWDAANRNMSRMGANFSTDRMLSEMNKNSIMGAANMTGALNNATSAAEDQKWNRNAGAYGQIAGMGNGAMQGMGSAASGYGQMSGQIASNNAANAAGYGKFGAAMAAGSKWADGGYIKKPGLHLASGGPAFQNYLKPVDWRSQPTTAGAGRGGSGLGQGLQMMGAMMAMRGGMDLIGDAWRGEKQKDGTYAGGWKDDIKGGLKSLWNTGKDAYNTAMTSPQTGVPEINGFQPGQTFQTYPDPSASDPSYAGGYGDYSTYTPSDLSDTAYLANGGYLKRGLHFAAGGYAQPIQEDQSGTDPWKFRGEAPNPYLNMAGNMAAMKTMNYGVDAGVGAIKDAFNSSGAGQSFIPSAPATPGVATVSPVVDTGAGITSTALPEAGAALTQGSVAGTTGTALAEGTAAGTTGTALAEGTAAGTALAEGTAAGTALAEGATTAAATEGAAAGLGSSALGAASAAMPWLGAAAAIYAIGEDQDWWANGGPVPHESRGLQRKNLKPGGKVQGPGTETSDDIPAWLSDGEYVLNAEAVKLIGREKLDALNHRGLQMRGQKEEVAEGHPGVKDSPAEEKREARGLKAKPVKKAKGGMIKRKGC